MYISSRHRKGAYNKPKASVKRISNPMTIPRHNYKTGSPTSLKKNKCLDKKAFSGRYIFIIYVRRRRSTMVCSKTCHWVQKEQIYRYLCENSSCKCKNEFWHKSLNELYVHIIFFRFLHYIYYLLFTSILIYSSIDKRRKPVYLSYIWPKASLWVLHVLHIHSSKAFDTEYMYIDILKYNIDND